MKGLADAIADPAAATKTALDLVEANGNPSFLSLEGETFRWDTDAKALPTETPAGTGIGVPDVAALQAELDAYAEVGLFGGTAPDAATFVDAAPIEAVYDGTDVIWPSADPIRVFRAGGPRTETLRCNANTRMGVPSATRRRRWHHRRRDRTPAGGLGRDDGARRPFAMSKIDVRGVPMRVFDSAPPTMRAIWELARVLRRPHVRRLRGRALHATPRSAPRCAPSPTTCATSTASARGDRVALGHAQLPGVGRRLLGDTVDRRRRRRDERVVDDAGDGVRPERLAAQGADRRRRAARAGAAGARRAARRAAAAR